MVLLDTVRVMIDETRTEQSNRKLAAKLREELKAFYPDEKSLKIHDGGVLVVDGKRVIHYW